MINLLMIFLGLFIIVASLCIKYAIIWLVFYLLGYSVTPMIIWACVLIWIILKSIFSKGS